MRIYNREVAIKALVGSHNYNLNTENSDKDYKYFVYPNFDDLYAGQMFAFANQTEAEDWDVHDVRKLADLLWKANPNYIEVLYSRDLYYDRKIEPLFVRNFDFSSMNLPKFYNACYGSHQMKMKELHKGTAKTQVLVDTFGYDTKQACHAMRLLYLLERATRLSMGNALYFEDGAERKTLLDIKQGKYSEKKFRSLVVNWHEDFFKPVKAWYDAQREDEYMRELVDNLIKRIIKQKLNSS